MDFWSEGGTGGALESVDMMNGILPGTAVNRVLAPPGPRGPDGTLGQRPMDEALFFRRRGEGIWKNVYRVAWMYCNGELDSHYIVVFFTGSAHIELSVLDVIALNVLHTTKM